MRKPDVQSTPVVQEEPKAGTVISHPEYPVEPSTGLPVSVITTGQCPEKSIGDTLAKPDTFTVESPDTKQE